ncbi:MAG: c-type cytochrome [Gammaproteobacteria bacterium]|jgi:cytochrome c553
MKRKKTAKRLNWLPLISLLALLSLSSTMAWATGDAATGKEKSQVCQGCHGVDGNSYAPNFPNLAEQHVSYITKQLHNYQDGKRVNETMSSMVTGLSDQDIKDIAAYFSSQALQPQAPDKDVEVVKTGRKIYKGGNVYTGVPACAGCHGPNGVGNSPAAFPHLAGQKPTYVMKTLHDFKAGKRSNDVNEIMRNIASKLTDNEIAAVAAYVATLNTQK